MEIIAEGIRNRYHLRVEVSALECQTDTHGPGPFTAQESSAEGGTVRSDDSELAHAANTSL